MTPLAAAAGFSVALLLAIVGFLLLVTYNAFVALDQRIAKAWANIDVVLKQRHDELAMLVEAVRDVMAFEAEVVTNVARLRAAYSPTAPVPEQAATSDATSIAVRRLFAVVERYPELHSQQNVLDLQNEIERLEGMIADRRELYNDSVYRYHTRLGQQPGALVGWVFGWHSKPFFSATPAEAAAPAVQLEH